MEEGNISISNNGLGRKRTVKNKKEQELNIIDTQEITLSGKAFCPCQMVKKKETENQIQGEGIRYYVDEYVDGCSICKVQVENPESFITKKTIDLMLYRKDPIDFGTLVEYLLPPKDTFDLEGCEIRFPDTAFFGADGKPTVIVKTDKDGKLSQTSQANKL
jgi:hypothetical protein